MRILFLYYFLFPQVSHPQASTTGLADQFFRNKTIAWQKSYSGLWDDVIPVQLELVSDGEICKGYFYFGDPKNKYVVSGSVQQNEITLEEQDLLANITGRMILQLEDKSIKGTWYNINRSFNARLSMTEGISSQPTSYWIRSYGLKSAPEESMLLLHKEFTDQIHTRFYFKLLNKTLNGTSEIKGEENYYQESILEDYLHHSAGKLNTWKVNEKRLDIHYTLGTIEYIKSLDLLLQLPITQETYADHWMAVDISYPKLDKPEITAWYRSLIDSFLIVIQDKKNALAPKRDLEESHRLSYRMSLWPQIEFLNDKYLSGMMHIKNSWDETISSLPFFFDLKKGRKLSMDDLVLDSIGFERIKNSWIQKELEKLASVSELDYKSLKASDFNLMIIRKEGIIYATPFDIMYGHREILIPYTEVKNVLSPRYFPL